MKTMIAAILVALIADGARAQQTLSPDVLAFYLRRYESPPPVPVVAIDPQTVSQVVKASAPVQQAIAAPAETGFSMGIRRAGRALVRVAK